MIVLFISQSEFLHPWGDDFIEALGNEHQVRIFDPDRPLEEQFHGIGAVVDHGGVLGTHAMMDLAAREGARLWQIIGTGLDHVDIPYILGKGLRLANTPGVFSAPALAEHALMLMLCLAKNLNAAQADARTWTRGALINEELGGKTLGLLGFGASARALARRAAAMDMRLMAIDIASIDANTIKQYGLDFFGPPQQLDRLLKEADFLSIHVPLLRETHHMIARPQLKKMKPTAVLINVARGGIVDEAALIEALRSGVIRGAGLDTFDPEPPDPANPLFSLENVIVTPHIAGGTRETSKRRGVAAATNIIRLAQGLPPLHEIVL